MEKCSNCGSEIPEVADRCFTCGRAVEAPNVRGAGRQDRRDALEKRYAEAMEDARSRGCQDRLLGFDEGMKNTSTVINVDADFLYAFVTKEKSSYSTYSLSVRGQIRKPAKVEDDTHRSGVEGALFGSYGEQIRYGALSLDGAGVKSYGQYAMKLREVAVRERASLMEDNSYVFVEKHNIRSSKDVPAGYTSTWQERNKLAVAKLAARVSPAITEADYSGILLFSEGKYETDDFIEVHIYGPFDSNAVESVRGSSSAGTKGEKAFVENVKEYLFSSGKRWVEE